MTRLALAAALAAILAAPPATLAASGTARLLVSATVVRSVQVSVSGGGGPAALRVQTSGGAAWSADVQAAASVPGVGLSPCATDPSYVVVTVLADAPFPAGDVVPRS